MELPTIRCYGPPLARRVNDGSVPENLLDRSVRRVLTMKCELGRLDDGWSAALDDLAGRDDLDHLDPPEHRALARQPPNSPSWCWPTTVCCRSHPSRTGSP